MIYCYERKKHYYRRSSLIVGCVKIKCCIYMANDGLQLGYNLFVKDDLDSADWIFYDSPSDTVETKETDLFSILDRVISENGLSYTECCFEKLDDKIIKAREKKYRGKNMADKNILIEYNEHRIAALEKSLKIQNRNIAEKLLTELDSLYEKYVSDDVRYKIESLAAREEAEIRQSKNCFAAYRLHDDFVDFHFTDECNNTFL